MQFSIILQHNKEYSFIFSTQFSRMQTKKQVTLCSILFLCRFRRSSSRQTFSTLWHANLYWGPNSIQLNFWWSWGLASAASELLCLF